MELSLFDRGQRARVENRLLCYLLIVIAIGAVILMPLSYWVSYDVLLQDTVLPILIDFLIELCNYLFFWGSFATVLYLIYRYGFSHARAALFLYAGAAALRYLAYLLAGYLVLGFPRTLTDAWQDDIVYLLLDILFDLLQMGVFLLFAYFMMERKCPARSAGRPYPAWLPYESVFGFASNPLLATTAISAAIPSVIRLLSRVRYDLSFGGASDLGDLLWQIFSYASDIIYLGVGFAVILLMIQSHFLRDTRAKALYTSEQTLVLASTEEEKN